MTPIDAEHAALLRGIAKNTNDQTARKVYADWLQERGNPGWLVLMSYRPRDWVVLGPADGSTPIRSRYYGHVLWRLPWLPGYVEFDKRIAGNALSVLKHVLRAYAAGQTVDPQTEKSDGEDD